MRRTCQRLCALVADAVAVEIERDEAAKMRRTCQRLCALYAEPVAAREATKMAFLCRMPNCVATRA